MTTLGPASPAQGLERQKTRDPFTLCSSRHYNPSLQSASHAPDSKPLLVPTTRTAEKVPVYRRID